MPEPVKINFVSREDLAQMYEHGRRSLVAEKVFGGRPDYAWYAIGIYTDPQPPTVTRYNGQTVAMTHVGGPIDLSRDPVMERFRDPAVEQRIKDQTGLSGGYENFDLEFHGSEYVKGNVLRVRGATRTPETLDLGDGLVAQLYQLNSGEHSFSLVHDKRVNFVTKEASVPKEKQGDPCLEGFEVHMEGAVFKKAAELAGESEIKLDAGLCQACLA